MSDLEIYTQVVFEPDDVVELRFIKKGERPFIRKDWKIAADLSNAMAELTSINGDGFDIYAGPNPRTEKGLSGDTHVKVARCLFCDFDHIEPGDGCGRSEFVSMAIFEAELPEPNLYLSSGNGVHVYWRLDTPITDLLVWTEMQERLNGRLEADPVIKNPERIMRLPGFINWKTPQTESYLIHANVRT
jgi:hypothetical protein